VSCRPRRLRLLLASAREGLLLGPEVSARGPEMALPVPGIGGSGPPRRSPHHLALEAAALGPESPLADIANAVPLVGGGGLLAPSGKRLFVGGTPRLVQEEA